MKIYFCSDPYRHVMSPHMPILKFLKLLFTDILTIKPLVPRASCVLPCFLGAPVLYYLNLGWVLHTEWHSCVSSVWDRPVSISTKKSKSLKNHKDIWNIYFNFFQYKDLNFPKIPTFTCFPMPLQNYFCIECRVTRILLWKGGYTKV